MASGPKWNFEVRYWKPPAVTDKEVKGELQSALREAGDKAVKAFRNAAPSRTGYLRNNIEYRVMGGSQVGIRITMPWYGRITIQGLPGTREPKQAKALKIVLKGGSIIYRKKAGPVAANPWHLRARAEANAQVKAAGLVAAKAMAELLKRRTQ